MNNLIQDTMNVTSLDKGDHVRSELISKQNQGKITHLRLTCHLRCESGALPSKTGFSDSVPNQSR